MTVLELLQKALGGSLPNLIQLLESVAVNAPDLAPKAREWIEALNGVAGPANLANVATAVVRELADIGQGKLNPKNHPSDAA